MIAKDLEQIAELDLESLKDNAVPEGKTIDYKQILPGDSDSKKKEFLADVSSFANANGGDLLFGIVESGGIPRSIDGLVITDIDQEKLRLESIIRDGIQPRIIGIGIQPIPLSNSRVVLLIRIPKSWNSPHRVIFKGHDKFYSRNSSGKYSMDVAELRVSFNLSETLTEKIRGFNLDRASKIYSSETPVPLSDTAKISLHIIPIVSFSPAQHYDIGRIASSEVRLKPMYCGSWNDRYNLDGFLAYAPIRDSKSHSYVQVYRNGIIEAVETLLLEPREEVKNIPSIAYERELISSVTEYLSILNTLGIELPIFIFLDLLGVKGYSMTTSRLTFVGGETIDREMLLLPEIVVYSYEEGAAHILKPAFDSIWNSCGFPRSLNYNEEGDWAPPR